jgi:cyclic pyranopterin phosphate synthase
MEPLRESWRLARLKSLRISVTDKCNFRCRYCMPAEGLEVARPAEELLSYEEIARLAKRHRPRWASRRCELTGGEPLVRRDLPVSSRCSRHSRL